MPHLSRRAATAAASALGLVAASIGLWTATGTANAASTLPTPDHVIVVMMENHSYSQIIGSSSAPYINKLATGGALLTQSYGLTHPSQPNYYDIFSGDTQGITDDSCITAGFSSADNLASELTTAGKTWGSYNEGLASDGDTSCKDSSTAYAQKHNPWFGFSNVDTSTAYTFDEFPTDYTTLPTVSFVVPNLDDDMHDGTIKAGDTWLKTNLGAYATWAKTHNSLLIVTYDEDNYLAGNQIPTVVYGQGVTAGSTSSTTYSHYDVLRTIEDMYGTGYAGNSSSGTDITGIWG